MDRTPSQYQAAIIDWIEHGHGDAIVEAVAGSGKTTTLEMAWAAVRRQSPNSRAIFLAFNRSVANELKARLPGLETKTLHSLGYQPTRAALGTSVKLDESKYVRLAAAHLATVPAEKDRTNLYLAQDIAQVTRLARMSLTDVEDEGALRRLAEWHNIGRGFGRVGNYLNLIPTICSDGRALARRGQIDFTDQLWLPAVLNLRVPTYDWVFVDESQDLNLAQLELIKRSRRRGGRLLFVGDPAQAIYGFAGADANALRRVERELSATTLPLSVTYRCPITHVVAASQIVPQLEARPEAPYGTFAEITIWDALNLIGPDDLILSREVAPAVAVQRYLAERHLSAFVDDAERRKDLQKLLESYQRKGIPSAELETHLQDAVERADASNSATDHKRLDAIRALLIVVSGLNGGYGDYLREIDTVFAPRDKAARCLTIHKAKGLEASRVFLIRPDLLPHRYAVRDWQRMQEENLLYVALTRAKAELYICEGELPLNARVFGGKQSPLQSAEGIWGTGFTVLRGQPTPAETRHRPTARPNPYERQHYFHDGVCVHCEKQETLARQFGWRCN